MQTRNLIAMMVAAAFAGSAYAGGDKASAGSSKPDGGAEAMFKALDKDKDGNITKAEAKGTPHEKDFSSLDKNGDGKLTPEEHAAAPEHAGKAGASSGASGGSTGAPGGSKKTY
jgi:hypothetical protein